MKMKTAIVLFAPLLAAAFSAAAQETLTLAEREGSAGSRRVLDTALALRAARQPMGDAARPRSAAAVAAAPRALTGGRVNDPARDLMYSSFAGMTQVNSSTAWCAPNVVTVFATSSGLAAFSAGLTNDVSLFGYSYSSNNGATFHDAGSLEFPGTGFLSGEASAACIDADHFVAAAAGIDGIGVQRSTDGGTTFSFVALLAPSPGHSFATPWVAADPTLPLPGSVLLTYVDEGSDPSCGGSASSAVAVRRSTDGGLSWGETWNASPVSCAPSAVSNPALAVGGDGAVHMAWFTTRGGIAHPTIVRSTDGGITFAETGSPVLGNGAVGDLAFSRGPDKELLQGGIVRQNRPQIAVDRSGKPGFDNTVYVVLDVPTEAIAVDGIPGLALPPDDYQYGGVVVLRSNDGGATYPDTVFVRDSVPTPTGPFANRDTDAFGSGIGVDRNGALGVCWYDRRNDPANFVYDRYCARSVDRGGSFTSHRKTLRPSSMLLVDPFLPLTIGDFDTVANDFTLALPGFRGGYTDTSAGQADVRMSIF